MSILSFVCHPVTLAAAAVLAIGVVIYEIVNQEEERNHRYQGSQRPRPNKKSTSPSSGASTIKSYEEVRDGVRRRKPNETEAKTCSRSQSKQKSSEKPTRTFNEEDYCQNVCDKIGNDVKNLNKDNDKKTFQKTIDYQLNDTSVDAKEIKVINIPTSNENRECPQNVLSNNICKHESNPTNIDDPCCSTQNTGANDAQNLTETDNPFCRACEEVLADAVTFPCKHCYLCINCATIIHRIYKKCYLCESEIKYFQPLEK